MPWRQPGSRRVHPLREQPESLEKAAAPGSSSSVVLRVPARREEVLGDRKTIPDQPDVLGDEGVIVLDTVSQLPWSRAPLDDELAHDANLDVEALYCVHSVFEGAAEDPKGRDITWLHSHGLAELGGFDIDFIRPDPEFVDQGSDIYRALATAIHARSRIHKSPTFVCG